MRIASNDRPRRFHCASRPSLHRPRDRDRPSSPSSRMRRGAASCFPRPCSSPSRRPARPRAGSFREAGPTLQHHSIIPPHGRRKIANLPNTLGYLRPRWSVTIPPKEELAETGVLRVALVRYVRSIIGLISSTIIRPYRSARPRFRYRGTWRVGRYCSPALRPHWGSRP